MSLGHAEAYRAASVSEQALSDTVLHTTDARGWKRISFQAIFAGYTAVTVKLQASLDAVTFVDIPGFTISLTDCIIIGSTGPFKQIRVVASGTLSGGADTLEVWLGIEKAPR